MNSTPRIHLLLLAACALWPAKLPASPSGVKTKSQLNLSFGLQPVDPASGLSGEAKIKIRSRDGVSVSRLNLDLGGLPAGTYQVEALDADAAPVHLGQFTIPEAGSGDTGDAAAGNEDGAEPGDDSAGGVEVKIDLAPEVKASAIQSISIRDAAGAALLEGSLSATVGTSRFFAEAEVTGPVADAVAADDHHGKGRGRRVHGHVTLHSNSTDGVETERHVTWVAFNGPAGSELTILVDGVAAGTVTSTPRGKVKFAGLAEEIPLAGIQKIELVDEVGVVVMQVVLAP